jgi:hypothetical protein
MRRLASFSTLLHLAFREAPMRAARRNGYLAIAAVWLCVGWLLPAGACAEVPIQLDVLGNGTLAPSDVTSIRGRALGPPNSGISANGNAGVIGPDGMFVVDNVRLRLGANVIHVVLTTADGRTLSKDVSISSDGTFAPYVVTMRYVTSVAPATFVARVYNRSGAPLIGLEVAKYGDGNFVAARGADEAELSYDRPGLYRPAFRMRDRSGKPYTVQKAVRVLERTELVDALRNTWRQYLEALSAGDAARADALVSANLRTRMHEVHRNSAGRFPEPATFGELRPGSIGGDVAEFVVSRKTPKGQRASFVYFVVEDDGVWRINQL